MMGKALGISVALGAGFLLGPLYLAMGLVGVGYLIGESRGRANAEDLLRLGPGPRVAGRLPGPIETLNTFLRSDREPPPIVVAYAMAESRLIGRDDLADDLERVFMGRKMITLPNSDVVITQRSAPASAAQMTAAPGQQAMQPTAADSPTVDPAQVPMTGPSDATSSAGAFVGFAPQDVGAAHSPLPGVPDEAWADYCNALAREQPMYDSNRRVGRYEHRKDRLRELGLDPGVLTHHPRALDLQDAALAIDAADSAQHIAASGTDARIGAALWIPDDPEPHKITLSGLLGVAHVAGLEGMIGWLEHRDDRKRFPHTTATFIATNGAF
jgi:hypothetical protein